MAQPFGDVFGTFGPGVRFENISQDPPLLQSPKSSWNCDFDKSHNENSQKLPKNTFFGQSGMVQLFDNNFGTFGLGVSFENISKDPPLFKSPKSGWY